jgi:hypothetical protein
MCTYHDSHTYESLNRACHILLSRYMYSYTSSYGGYPSFLNLQTFAIFLHISFLPSLSVSSFLPCFLSYFLFPSVSSSLYKRSVEHGLFRNIRPTWYTYRPTQRFGTWLYSHLQMNDYYTNMFSNITLRGVSRVWQAGHVPWAPLAGGSWFVWVSTF